MARDSATGGVAQVAPARVAYAVVIEAGPRSYGASVPDLPGCFVVAETLEELLASLPGALAFHLEGLGADGDSLPAARTQAMMVGVAVPPSLHRNPAGTSGQRYAIVVEQGAANFSAYAPDVLGYVATGKTVQETIGQMIEALVFHFEGMAEDGEPIPERRTRVAMVEVALP